METVEGTATIKARKKPKLAIEDYLDFIDDRTRRLTASQLRLIIGMHGFRKMSFQKAVMVDMVTSIDLMDLRRSTVLDDGVSGDASFTLEEVINDLKDLDWQECHVTSLLTEGGVVSAYSSSAAAAGGDDCAISVKRKKTKRLRRRKAIEAAADDSVISTGTTVAAGSPTEISKSLVCTITGE